MFKRENKKAFQCAKYLQATPQDQTKGAGFLFPILVSMQVIEQKGKCRNQEVSIHNHNGSKFCPNCNHRSLTDIQGVCLCCKVKIPNKRKLTELKVFDKIIDACSLSIQEWAADPTNPDLYFGWPVRIGIINYFVPVRYLAEYMEMPNLEGDNKEFLFLENVKSECTVLSRFMYAIK